MSSHKLNKAAMAYVKAMSGNAKPKGEAEDVAELQAKLRAKEAKEGPEGDEESESPAVQAAEDALGVEKHKKAKKSK